MIDTVIFDLDGTLLNTIEDLKNSINRILVKYHYLPKTKAQILSYVGNGLAKLVERCLIDGINNPNYKNILDDFIIDYKENCMNDTCVYAGINELLLKLKQKNIKLAIISNKQNLEVQKLANHFFGTMFDFVLGEIKELTKKPAPDMVLYAINKLNTKIENVLYVGDSEVDIETAKNANIPCLSVTWGFRKKDVLINAGATILIDEPKEILSYI